MVRYLRQRGSDGGVEGAAVAGAVDGTVSGSSTERELRDWITDQKETLLKDRRTRDEREALGSVVIYRLTHVDLVLIPASSSSSFSEETESGIRLRVHPNFDEET